tara:strand:- start:26 stop:370 length:345 start_codon:yes stop_codon:yes gene_type:complete
MNTCNICFKEGGIIFGDSCEIIMCIECDSKLGGLCEICGEIFCEDCLFINNSPSLVYRQDKYEGLSNSLLLKDTHKLTNVIKNNNLIFPEQQIPLENLLKKISSKFIQKKMERI